MDIIDDMNGPLVCIVWASRHRDAFAAIPNLLATPSIAGEAGFGSLRRFRHASKLEPWKRSGEGQVPVLSWALDFWTLPPSVRSEPGPRPQSEARDCYKARIAGPGVRIARRRSGV